ncbi:MAG TPA: TetR/AcrR family transcriptional regulator [Chroococcales cyanobacterium]
MASKGARSHLRDPEWTRKSILDAAEEEFATQGLAGARTESIAERSGASKAMIHYHFDTKEKLYKAVIERAMTSRQEITRTIDIDAVDATTALQNFSFAYLQACIANPHQSQVLLFEAVSNKGKYSKSLNLLHTYEVLTSILKKGMDEGSFRQGDTMHMAVNIVGTLVFYFCARENLRALWPNRDLMESDLFEAHCQEAVKQVIAGVRA